MQTINDSINGETYTVESCNCPTGHTGQFCDECMDGYYRPSGNPLDACIQCACNGYSTSCNQLTGVCNNCTNSTEGDQCERCTTGYYSNGVECLPCTCPTIGNSYSKTCLYINETVHCDACQTGYTGSQCQECQNGYYRDQIVSIMLNYKSLQMAIVRVETVYNVNAMIMWTLKDICPAMPLLASA